jgi:MoxR-like ATPase
MERDAAAFPEAVRALAAAIGRAFLGHAEVVEQLILGVFAGGHVLLEGVPGLGKTTLVKALAAALDLDFRRIQFTPDMMPSDVLGSRILEEDGGVRRFTFERGPIFASVILADEINRATPRTQSALLESMQERQVTVHGETLALEDPFLVVATQNPIEMEGTYPLPEAQLDRFALQVLVPFPSAAELTRVLAEEPLAPPAAASPANPRPVLARADVRRLRQVVHSVPASSDVVERVARLVLATHPRADSPENVRRYVRHGASPRGGLALLGAARACALSRGRLHVADEDVDRVAAPALRHRLILGYEGEASGVSRDELVAAALEASRG